MSMVVFVGQHGIHSLHRAPAWAISDVRLKVLPHEDASAGDAYERTAVAPLALATVAREMRTAWPHHSIGVINGAALEVGTALLHRSDIEVGELVGGIFVPAEAARWTVNQQMIAEIEGAPALYQNEHAYVFRRK